ncbi:peptide/nickel transport system substrate-binding protein/oligopeptide transport system substrate-binding protein [Motilibacter rhizosphaerae]|uniref:Peptide/nickel transport system substrate-binding protein/oligopeptide transport system substrate-binding protein n=1 Tax=Motilibacter rhizosphaerae TaxID=598652 RepID=A0A4V2F4E0_9ACTN|nr:ABC transporter substrate-binding protein [Motilibacter rhizosphaerae]RZS87277.1 peptide/nickel transport system substrate-binding protein/oligopeptide transport system substrate-binding protein [Motilibacter rhizosphaerae]
MQSRVLGRWAVGATALSLALAACGGSSGGSKGGSGGSTAAATTAAKDGGTVSISLSDPQFLTPGNTQDTNGAEVLDALFTGLIKFDAQNKPVLTDLAQSIDSKDGLTWDVKIKSGWTFSNGEPVTADSFINAWNYAAYGPNGQQNSYFFGPGDLDIKGFDDLQAAKEGETPKAKEMSGLKKVSDTEFTVTLANATNIFKQIIGYSAFYPLPKAFFTDPKSFENAPIGNGPFKMKGTWVRNQFIDVVRNDSYAGAQKPHVQEIDYKMYKSAETSYNDLTAGALDIVTQIPSTDIARAKQDLGDRYQESPSSNFGFLGFPTFDPNYKDVNVRMAISMAIDRAALSKTIFSGTRVPADDFIAPIIPGYRKGACGPACTYDPAKAKQLWDAATTKPSTITLYYNADGGHKPWIDASCNSIQQALGVSCVGKAAPDFATLQNDLNKAKKQHVSFGAFRLGWSMDYPSMQDYLGPIFQTNASSNYTGYSNKAFDDLVNKGLTEATEDAAEKDWQQADDILAKDVPVAPVYFGSNQFGSSDKVANVHVDPFFRVDKFALSTK